MLKINQTEKLSSSAMNVWEAIGEFANLADWHPAVVTSTAEQRGEDTVRVLQIAGGGTLLEKLEAHDPEEMSLTYSIVEGPLPVSDYISTISVKPDGDETCSVEWSGQFNASGADDDAAMKIIEGIYTAGLSALKQRFG